MFFKGFICGFFVACVFALIWTIAKKLHSNRNGVQSDNLQYDDCSKSVDGLSESVDGLRDTVAYAQKSIESTISLLERIKKQQ